MNAKEKIEKLRTALNLMIDHVDYRHGACRMNEMVGAVLPVAILAIAEMENRIAELENKLESTDPRAKAVGEYWVNRLREEEARSELHANLNRGVANALGLPFGENWSDLPEKVSKMKQRIAELEEALTKIASYESMRFKLSPYEYGLLEQIVGIAEHALMDGE